MLQSNTEINQGDNSLAVVDNSTKTKNIEKTVNVEKTVTADTTKLEEGQKAILDEVIKIGERLLEFVNKGSDSSF